MSIDEGKTCVFEDQGEVMESIGYCRKIYDFSHKHYNYAVSYYRPKDKVINPKLIMRFDCKQIT